MRLKYCIPLLALTIPLLAGCIADKQAIKFTDDYPPAATGDQRAAPKEPGLTKSELANIELTVFGYLLARHFGQDGDYSAVFIASDESRTDVLRKKFPQHNPPLKPWWHLNQPPGQAPVDLDTGRPALVLTVEAADPVAPNDTETNKSRNRRVEVSIPRAD